MKRKGLVATTLAIVTLVACGHSLIKDPSFDLWCGNSLCAPWEATGKVTRVKSWHRSDFAAQLADDAMLSQLSTETGVSCIEFEVVADVAASAAVFLEMDFEDDGTSEFKQLIPESHWAKVTFNASAPLGYRSVRFILRKTGAGRAVLAQIKATSGSGCTKPLPATGRELGQLCTEPEQCASDVCEVFMLESAFKVCGECADDDACAQDLRCGHVRGPNAVHTACVPVQQESGALCDSDEQCQSGRCSQLVTDDSTNWFPKEKVCSTCASDDDCSGDQICGLVPANLGTARGCRDRQETKLGEPCQVDVECESGLCTQHLCAECDSTHTCAEPSNCKGYMGATGLLFVTGVALCVDPSGHASGEPCYDDADCSSHKCSAPELRCAQCFEENCDQYSTSNCVLRRQTPGTCR